MFSFVDKENGLLKINANYQMGCLLLAHLSRRLIGELIEYPWSGVRVILPVQCSSPQADPRVKLSNYPGHGIHERLTSHSIFNCLLDNTYADEWELKIQVHFVRKHFISNKLTY